MNNINNSKQLDDYSTLEIRDALIKRLGVHETSDQENKMQIIIIELQNIK